MTADHPAGTPWVTLFGDINIDVLMSIPSYPLPGADAMAAGLTLRPGGSVANTAIVLAKLGVPTRMIGRAGSDPWAEVALAPLIECGVDITNVGRDPREATGMIFIPVTPDGERTMFSFRGANLNIRVNSIRPELLQNSRFLHLSGYNFLTDPQREASWRAVELALEAGIPISLDVGVEPALKAGAEIERLLPKTSLLSLGMDEARPLFGVSTPEDVAQRALEGGVQLAAVKLGRRGCLLADHNQEFRHAGFHVEIVDTTGAGDAFCAGMLFSLLHGLDLPASACIANTLGALAVTVTGGGPVLPGRVELIDFLQEQENLKSEPHQQFALAELRRASQTISQDLRPENLKRKQN